jgi:hypothetical protein
MVVALLALVMATTGSAVAASLITSKQIKDGTIQTKDISKKARKALKGNRGAQGPAGAAGPQGPKGDAGAAGAAGAKGDKGDKGDRGPSNSYGAQGTGNRQLSTSAATPLVATSVSLAAGDYVVIGETGLTNISGATRDAWCTLDSSSGQIGETRSYDIASQRSSDATVIGHVSLSATDTVALNCYAGGTGVFIPAASTPAVEAIQVASAATQ